MYYLWYLLLGLAAGWIANFIVKGGTSSLLLNLVMGIVGSILGSLLFSYGELFPFGTLGNLAGAVIGSAALLWVTALVTRRKIRKDPKAQNRPKRADTSEDEATIELFGERLDASTPCEQRDRDEIEVEIDQRDAAPQRSAERRMPHAERRTDASRPKKR